MLNKTTLIGNLGRDPEVRTMNNGDSVATLNVATRERWKDKDGNPQERTEWHRVVVFNQSLIDVAQKYLRKGSMVFIEGANQTRKWQDSKGEDRYSTEIVLQKMRGELKLFPKKELGADYSSHQTGRSAGPQQGGAGGGAGGASTGGSGYPYDQLDDDVPF